MAGWLRGNLAEPIRSGVLAVRAEPDTLSDRDRDRD
jgi:hypothetical protein